MERKPDGSGAHTVGQPHNAAESKDPVEEITAIQDIEEGLRDSEAGRVIDNFAVRRRFGLG